MSNSIESLLTDAEHGFISVADTLGAIQRATGASEADSAKTLCLLAERDKLPPFVFWTDQGLHEFTDATSAIGEILKALASVSAGARTASELAQTLTAAGFESAALFVALGAVDPRIVPASAEAPPGFEVVGEPGGDRDAPQAMPSPPDEVQQLNHSGESLPEPLTTAQIAFAFGSLWPKEWRRSTLGKYLERGTPKSLEGAIVKRAQLGSREGRQWNPVRFAEWLRDKQHVKEAQIGSAFRTVNELRAWNGEWLKAWDAFHEYRD